MSASIEDINQSVKDNKGVLSLTMKTLVNASASGAKRCTPGNISKIRRELDEQGLGYFPPELATDQNTVVRIYELDGPASDIIDAVFQPGEENDNIIRCASLLKEVRTILCRRTILG